MGEPILEARGITKKFGPVTALADISIVAHPGEIIGLIGVNGAGKSTLMNILDGVIRPTSGEILVDGEKVSFANPSDARRKGIGFIHQHSTGFDHLSVADNITILSDQHGVFSRRQARSQAQSILTRLGFGHIDVSAKLAEMTSGARQMVDIARVLADDPKVILFDEPTSSLTRQEAEKLFEVIVSLRAEGRCIFYTSHFLDDVLALSDRVTVLRDGRVVMDESHSDLKRETLVTAMLSRELSQETAKQRPTPDGPVVLKVENLVPAGRHSVSFQLRQGEVLGFWGLLGSGRTEILRTLLGLERGQVERIELTSNLGAQQETAPSELLQHVGYVTEARQRDGLLPSLPIWQNVTAASTSRFAGVAGKMRRDAEMHAADEMVEKLSIKLGSVTDPVSSLSGGNQQKVILARWLVKKPQIYLFDEPTHGVDVGAKAQIHQVIHDVVDGGASAIVVSSEIEEIFGLCDRILVLREGLFVNEFNRDVFDVQTLLAAS